ncbi:unnamed protein product [Medioppia subpectinata]|uniref:sphingolipid 4-desaturase n=1 Tax=Medioppia subpectinata TaxID=1979941 RepID=A0A7R9KQW3_9ACAR|nr:unnamed protein product [Medioppia subpectinata]CAG2108158.1 unnamed protein product [Medioppia subpectinata]
MGVKRDYEWVYTDEPHRTRRALILAKYPQIKRLMCADPSLKWRVLCMVSIQLVSFYLIKDVTSFWSLFLLAYCFGGVINISLSTAIHELVHNHAFGPSRPMANKALAIFASLPIGVPMAGTFKKYHLLHHRYQGDDTLDTDIPSPFEAMYFNTTFTKTVWMVLQPLFYVIRPVFTVPSFMVSPTGLELTNITIQFVFNYLIGQWLGWHVVVYMIGGMLLCMGLHPMAGHNISEHYLLFSDRLTMLKDCNNNDMEYPMLMPETYSYYGPLNMLMHNVGYHVEHHDFPSIPGALLPRVRQIAPEFYDSLPSHKSWTYVIWKYITDPNIGPYSRVKRPPRFARRDTNDNIINLANDVIVN